MLPFLKSENQRSGSTGVTMKMRKSDEKSPDQEEQDKMIQQWL